MRVAIVHYHCAAGGVTRVIATTSAMLTAAGIRHLVLSGSPAPPPDIHFPHRPVEGLGYRDDAGPQAAEKLLENLRQSAAAGLGGPPDIWHFHNPSLGKNVLWPEIIRRLAHAGDRLLLHVHDLAEDGRPHNFARISGHRDLYPFGPRMRHAFINPRDHHTFLNCGMPEKYTEILANPIPPAPTPHSLPAARSPLLFAPIRGIRRKNLGELVLLAASAPAGCRIATSRPPADPDALRLHTRWQKFSAKHQLPIGFGVTDRFSPVSGAPADFTTWMHHATHLVTTSVAEGFGLPFLEALAHAKPLLGRDLAHLTTTHARQGIHFRNLYDGIHIPLEWVDRTILEGHLTHAMERTWRLYQRPLPRSRIDATLASMTVDGTIDFANLPEPLQQGVIERTLAAPAGGGPMVHVGSTTSPLSVWLARTLRDRLPDAPPTALSPWSPDVYQEKLLLIYQDLLAAPEGELSALPPSTVLDAHLDHSPFHFLLSAPEPAPKPRRFRAVVFDIYGTLLVAPAGGVKEDPDADPILREVLRQHGFDPPASPSAELHAAVKRHHAASPHAHPEVDLRVLWREMLHLEEGVDLTPLVTDIEAVWHPATPMPGAAEVIARLSRAGISLGLLSNAQCNTMNALGNIAPLFAPELTLLSYQHGMAKPHPALFQLLADRLAGRGISPGETLFVGNDPRHDIIPAAAASFRTALFTGHPDSLRQGDCAPDIAFTSWRDLLKMLSA